MFSLWRPWRNEQAQARRRGTRRPGLRVRPSVEALEERTLPSNFPLPQFISAGSPSAGQTPSAVAVGDFDGNGTLDIAVLDAGNDSVTVLEGKGDGTFKPANTIALPFTPGGIVAANFTQHPQPRDDLVITDTGGNVVSLLTSNADGTFAQQETFFPAGTGPTKLVVGYFDKSLSRPGLAVLDGGSGGSGLVSVLLNNGNGGFAPPISVDMGQGANNVAVGDFNGDGNPDLVTSNRADDGTNSLNIKLGDGLGGFTGVGGGEVPFNLPTATYTNAVVVGDFTGNGKADIATADLGSTVTVRLGTGTVSFQPPVTIPVGEFAIFLAAADFNRDGKLDLVTGSEYFTSSGNHVTVLLGDGKGGFSTLNVPAGSAPRAVAVGDFNGDGRPDLAFSNPNENTVTVLLNRPRPLDTIPFPTAPGVRDILDLTGIHVIHLRHSRHGHTRFLLTLTNISGETVQGPFFLLLGRLPKHVQLLGAGGFLAARTPYVDVGDGQITVFRPRDTMMVALDLFGLNGKPPHFSLSLDLLAGGALAPVAQGTINHDVSSLVSIIRGHVRRGRNGLFDQLLTLTNTGGSPIAGPLALVLDGLPHDAKVLHQSGVTTLEAPLGSPFVTISAGGLSAGETGIVRLEFSNPQGLDIVYQTRLLAGTVTP